MDKPPQFRSDLETSDIELKVTDADESVVGGESESTTNDANGSTTAGANESTAAGANGSNTAKPGLTADDRVMMQAGKKAKEQEFMKAYKAKQIKTRLKFGACAALVLAFYFSSVYFIFHNNDKAASALRKFQIAPLFACLGERDIAHYTMTEFSDDRTKETPNLIEQRTKILNKAITEMEKSGKPAIFTRLGVEQMLMKYGDRAQGLKFGDPLIARYPDLPSNYFWRAKTDLERMDYVNSVNEYKQAVEKLENLPVGQEQKWDDQLSKATWAAIFSGQTGEAEKFLELFKKHEGGTYGLQGLQSEILLSSCTDIAAPSLRMTSFWNEKLEAAYQRRIEKAFSIANKMNYSDVRFDALPSIYSFELLDQAMILNADSKRMMKYIDTNYDSASSWAQTLKARAALNRNNPKEAAALMTMNRYKWGYLAREQNLLEVSILEKTNKPNEAIRLIDKYLNLKPDDDYDDEESETRVQVVSSRANQQLLAVKASALCDIGQYKKALSLCDTLLSRNSHLIEPRLIKLRIFKALNDSEAEKQESANISSELAAWLAAAERPTHE
ncbi:MAG: hypothetical protein JST89_14490 [Cyanobacteria bacterium SZAS-4]|nr:hypothetical protein [Cyanobacteria bacterium SZAS-4]